MTGTRRVGLAPAPSSAFVSHLKKSSSQSPWSQEHITPLLERPPHLFIGSVFRGQMQAGPWWSQSPGHSGPQEHLQVRTFTRPVPFPGPVSVPSHLLLKFDMIVNGSFLSCQVIPSQQEVKILKEPEELELTTHPSFPAVDSPASSGLTPPWSLL